MAGDETIHYALHPPIPIRVRALVLLDPLLRSGVSETERERKLKEIDDAIEHDLEAASCGREGNRFTELGRTAAFWTVAQGLCEEGVL